MVGKFRNVEKVTCDSRHNTADLGIIIKGEGKFLQMGEHIPSHIGFYFGAHNVTYRCHIVVGKGIDDTKDNIKYTCLDDKGHRESGNIIGGSARYFPDYHRKDQFANRCKHSAQKVENEGPSMIFIVGQKSLYKF